MKNRFQILERQNRLEFWFIVRASNFIVTPKTPEMCRVSYTKKGVKYTVFCVAYTLAELALTEESEQIWTNSAVFLSNISNNLRGTDQRK